jgi:hypothetical protein
VTALEIRRPDDWQVLEWKVQLLVDEQDWLGLRFLLKDRHSHSDEEMRELSLWQTFTALKLKIDLKDLKKREETDCLYLAVGLKRFSLGELDQYQNHSLCDDREIQFWVKSFLEHRQKHFKQASAYAESAKALMDKRQEQNEFAKLFWMDGIVWDYRESLPGGPSPFELFMALVTNQDFINYVKRK